MGSFGFLIHPERPLARELCRDLTDWLVERGHEVRVPQDVGAMIARPDRSVGDDELVPGLDLLVGIGGDGTMLGAVDAASSAEVPVLGINVGQLGYLTTVEPEDARASLKRFLAGAFVVEQRMRIGVRIERRDQSIEQMTPGLNEALVERLELGHTVRLDVCLDGEFFTPYVADGVMVASPTGSTAYALSAGGPIVDPQYRAQLLVPVSPHMVFDRAMVLDPTTEIRLTVAGNRPAHLSIDGRSGGPLEVGDAVVCSADPVPARLIRFGAPLFHRVLKTKFGLSDR